MNTQTTVQQFFTWQDFATFAGSVTITVIGTNTIGSLFGRFAGKAFRRWLAFAIALACQYGAATYANGAHHHLKAYMWVIALANACLIYASALGLNQTAVSLTNDETGGVNAMMALEVEQWQGEKNRFLRSWFD